MTDIKLTKTLELRFASRKGQTGDDILILKVCEPSKGERAKRVLAQAEVHSRKSGAGKLAQWEEAFKTLKAQTAGEVSPAAFDLAWGTILGFGI